MFASSETPDQVDVVVVVDEVVVLVSVELELLDVEELLDDEESLEDEELLDDDELLDEEELLEDEESLDELLEEELLEDDELLDEEELELDDGAVGVTVSLQPATSAAVNSAKAATGASSFRRRIIMSSLLPVRTADSSHTVCRDSAGTSSIAIRSRRTITQP